MQLHQIKRRTRRKNSKRVGRGGRRGKTSGRGTKGQKARSGRKLRPEARDIIKKIPKKRGYRFAGINSEHKVFNLSILNNVFSDNEEVSPKSLLEKGLIKKKDSNRVIKILSSGEIAKKIFVKGCLFSQVAKEKIEKAGGKIA